MNQETDQARSNRIVGSLQAKYPGKACYDLDGRGLHFVCEVDPVGQHPEYDIAVEVILKSQPHKHLKMVQRYTILAGQMDLHIDDKVIHLKPGDTHVILPGTVHWATSDHETLAELYSVPGWTKQDHIVVAPSDQP